MLVCSFGAQTQGAKCFLLPEKSLCFTHVLRSQVHTTDHNRSLKILISLHHLSSVYLAIYQKFPHVQKTF